MTLFINPALWFISPITVWIFV